LVAAGHLVTGPVLIHCHVGLFSVISHFIVEAVLWVLIMRSPEQKHHQILLGVHQDTEEKPTEQGQTEKGSFL